MGLYDSIQSLAGCVFCVALLYAPAVDCDEIPTDDPYLSTSKYLPVDAHPDPIHRLEAVRTMWWEIPEALKKKYLGDSPAQRVIYRDTLTGAEVWLIRRNPGKEFVSFYSSMNNFNANGTMIEIGGYLMGVNGTGLCRLADLVDRRTCPSGPQNFLWDENNPDTGVCKRHNDWYFRLNVRTGEEKLLFKPGKDMSRPLKIIYSDDGKFMILHRQKNRKNPYIWVAEPNGNVIRKIDVKSISKDRTKDYMGGIHLYVDPKGKYWIIYSLNKAAANTSNAHQVWLTDLEGKIQIRKTKETAEKFDALTGALRRVGRDPVSRAIGHAGMSRSGRYRVERNGVKTCVQDMEKHEKRDLCYIPGSDHYDWSAAPELIMTRTDGQPGQPVYGIEVASGDVHRLVATNTYCRMNSYSHPSPDATKCLYRSTMLGDLDMYMAVVRYPVPPRNVRIRRKSDGIQLTWDPPESNQEIKGYRVYRGNRSGGPYKPVGPGIVKDKEFLDRPGTEPAWYVLTSVEQCGLEGRRFSDEVALSWPGQVNRYIEAETGTLTFPARRVFLPGECSDAYAVARAVRDPFWKPVEGNGVVKWSCELPKEGTYTLWIRARTRPGMTGEMSFRIDGGKVCLLREPVNGWQWIKLSDPVELGKGRHTIVCTMSVSGYEVDKLLLTTDPDAAPKGNGDTPVQAPEPVTGLTAKTDATGNHVILEWNHENGPLFHHFQVYRGESKDFEPSQRTLIGSPTTTAFIDPFPAAAGTVFYKVTAVDTWGNRSAVPAAVELELPERPAVRRMLVDSAGFRLVGGVRMAENPKVAVGKFAVFDDSAKEGAIEVPLDLPPGDYLVWAHARSERSKFRYMYVGLDISMGNRKYDRCSVRCLSQTIYTGPYWAWRRVYTKDRNAIPGDMPLKIRIDGEKPTLVVRYRNGYAEIDRLFITSSVHDLPAPEAVWYSPDNPCRFQWPSESK